jgi:hypothetical protein
MADENWAGKTINQLKAIGVLLAIDERAIDAAIIAMSRTLHINVTAEDVESFPQLFVLAENGAFPNLVLVILTRPS